MGFSDDFEAYVIGDYLSDTSDWSVSSRSNGPGRPRTDTHNDHSNGTQVMDMSAKGATWNIVNTPLTSADHFAEVDCFIDTHASSGNGFGPLVRLAQTTSNVVNVDGYHATLEVDVNGAPNEVNVSIYKVVAGSRGTPLVTSAALGGLTHGLQSSVHTIRLEAQGNVLTAYSDGVQVAQITDTTYPANLHVGYGSNRNLSHVDSQPFAENFNSNELSSPQPPLFGFNGELSAFGSGTLYVMTGSGLVAA